MRLDALPEATRRLYESLLAEDALEPFTLVGGTALALQIAHRKSLDLDFAVFTRELPKQSIQACLTMIEQGGGRVANITSPEQASRFRINTGLSLENFAQDYEIDGVKVTFFVHGKNDAQRQFYCDCDKLYSTDRSFNVLSLAGLQVAKSLVLADRIRSRDLFDLMTLMRQYGWSIEQLVAVVKELGHNSDVEHYFSAMTGDLPLDRGDEGFTATEVTIEIDEVYDFFRSIINEWQVAQAELAYRS